MEENTIQEENRENAFNLSYFKGFMDALFKASAKISKQKDRYTKKDSKNEDNAAYIDMEKFWHIEEKLRKQSKTESAYPPKSKEKKNGKKQKITKTKVKIKPVKPEKRLSSLTEYQADKLFMYGFYGSYLRFNLFKLVCLIFCKAA